VLPIVVLATLVWSGIRPADRFTWWLEVAPVLIGLPLVLATRRRLPLTPLVYLLLTVHAVILSVGGHSTYAEVPIGFRVGEWFGWSRNHYDRLGHFAQGFVPAIVARELLQRSSPLRPGTWLTVLVVCVCLAISAAYELIEWGAAVWTGGAAAACTALATLGPLHDRQLARISW